jgi:ribulose-bisphosphate carboxylase large chain
MERITATYYIETPYDPGDAARVLAGEQSSGTFVPVPGETAALKERFAARVESVEQLESVTAPAIPGATAAANGKYHRAMVRVSWSTDNFGYNLPVMVSTLQGNLYEIKQFTGLKLMDLDLPASFGSHFKGPAFGVDGCRSLAGVYGRPLIGTIIKPSIGLSPDDTALLVKELAAAGIDFIKDDELLSSSANSSFEDRVDAVMAVINAHADKTGGKIMYAFNISGEMDQMMRRYEKIVKSGGICAMISINSCGLTAVKKICDLGALAIHGHRNGWGMLNRHPLLGIDFRAYQKIWRLAGVDQLHVNGIQNKFWESDDSVVSSIKACLNPLFGQQTLLPVVSSGQWGGQAFETWRRTATLDLLYLAGGGIMAHPSGPGGGVKALKQAWQAAAGGMSRDEAAAAFAEFGQSVEKFGKKG